MKATTTLLIFGALFIVLGSAFVFYNFYFAGVEFEYLPPNGHIIYNYSYIIETCDGLNITEAALCMNQILRQVPMNWSNYIYVGEEDFFKEGGVCRHFSNIYRKAAEELGFRTQTIRLSGIKIPHEYVVIYDENTYISLDQHSIVVMTTGDVE